MVYIFPYQPKEIKHSYFVFLIFVLKCLVLFFTFAKKFKN